MAAMAGLQPLGNTLDTARVKTKTPFLLKGQLREYQHIGLDWLVTLYHKRLNGGWWRQGGRHPYGWVGMGSPCYAALGSCTSALGSGGALCS